MQSLAVLAQPHWQSVGSTKTICFGTEVISKPALAMKKQQVPLAFQLATAFDHPT